MTCGKQLPIRFIPLSTSRCNDIKTKVYCNYINMCTCLSWAAHSPLGTNLLWSLSRLLTPPPTLPFHAIPRYLSIPRQLHFPHRITCNMQYMLKDNRTTDDINESRTIYLARISVKGDNISYNYIYHILEPRLLW